MDFSLAWRTYRGGLLPFTVSRAHLRCAMPARSTLAAPHRFTFACALPRPQ